MIVIPALYLKYGKAEEYARSREMPQGPELAAVSD